MIAAGAMNMTMSQLVLSRVPDRHYFDIEIQRFAGQRVIAVDGNIIAIDIDYRDHART